MLKNCNIGAGRLRNGKILKLTVFLVLEPFPIHYGTSISFDFDGELGRRLYSSIWTKSKRTAVFPQETVP